MTKMQCDLLVIGGGPGGYAAAFRAADLGLNVVIAEARPTLGGVCLNVGCIPSKTYLHQAALIRETAQASAGGVVFDAPQIDLDAMRAHKNGVVGKLVGGLSALAKARNVAIVHGYARFTGAGSAVVTGSATDTEISFKHAIVAVGSEPARLSSLPEHSRVLDSTGALELPAPAGTLLIVGGGIIGLEMATVYSALGWTVDIVEFTGSLMPGADRDLVAVWDAENRPHLRNIMLQTSVRSAAPSADAIRVEFETAGAPLEARDYDYVIGAVGRLSNGPTVAPEAAGLALDDRGFITVDVQMRTAVANIFAIGDVVGGPMLAHKAAHQGHVAAEVIAGEQRGDAAMARVAFDARVIPAVAYTSPEVAWAGLTEAEAAQQDRKVDVARFPWAASGRALANGCSSGFTKLLFEADVLVGGAIVGPGAGDMIGEIALAVEMGCLREDLALTIHPHPTLGETIGLAAEVALGTCTDLPKSKSRKSAH